MRWGADSDLRQVVDGDARKLGRRAGLENRGRGRLEPCASASRGLVIAPGMYL